MSQEFPSEASSRPPGAAPGVHRQRVIFIDLARSLAVVFMLYGHTVDALLAPSYRAGTWYDVWQFQRGLTSSLFLLLSGFAFSIATTRRWSSHVRVSRAFLDRTRRFLLFVLLGYGLHFPVPTFGELSSTTEAQWRAFLAVDVLQLIGSTLVFIQLLVLVTRTRLAFTIVALLLGAVIIFVTPVVWTIDWTARLPLSVSSYLSPSPSGSFFPLFPWSAYILLGIALGQIYGRWGAANLGLYANAALLLPGALMVLAGLGLRELVEVLYGQISSNFVPPEVLVRAGTCLLIVGVIAHGSRRLSHLPHIFGAVAQETLLIYFVHLCIVYGSIWSPGLFQLYGATLSPIRVLAIVVALLAAMTALAWQWNWLKHASPRSARWISVVVGTGLVLWLV
ncbi:MAG TPA: heparan-alpha-glucosaminide N-acetyltransferase domain-containing protein [Vicinamibacterales bacterium]|nr:heparan-alpha-glucosaminide N-acetyltransferase domain-containing protein [Vicinamibacterales bacterium]